MEVPKESFAPGTINAVEDTTLPTTPHSILQPSQRRYEEF